ncbi:MAG: PT domain-containing protein, partial [Clostridia bacterium]|nr:PT domain-containing protein [Clostridia bacterium]
IALLLVFCLIPGIFACSAARTPADDGSSPAPTEGPATAAPTAGDVTAAPTDAPTEAPTAAPTEVPVEEEALRLAALHGLGKDDLRGEYALFLRFSEALEANQGIDEYKDFVYRIFPVIADGKEYLDEDFFFPKLTDLTIEVAPISDSANGMFFDSDSSIYISESMMETQPYRLAPVLFHELMHFVDFGINGYVDYAYILDGQHLHQYEVDRLPREEQDRAILCGNSSIIKESGAELYTTKYFSGAPSAYFKGTAFMTGIEYIMGEEFMNALFFRWDSGAVLAELFLEVGYTAEEYQRSTLALAALSEVYNGEYDPISPEDMLIDLYEYKLGDGWREDEDFHYILKSINGIAMDDWKRSEHADFLKTIEFRNWNQYNAFNDALLADVPENPDLAVLPPIPFMRDGKLLIGDIAVATDLQTGEAFNCCATFDFDFASGTLEGYGLIDLDAFNAEFFPGVQ